MKLFYDLHLHSCLSPCGSDDMTPNNLVNMAALLGFQLIAVTDHNACANTEAAVRAGCAAGITVVPGMELCTSEEAHIVCLFPTPAAALAFEREVARRSPPVRNRPEIFGRQLVLDADDALLREEDRYLLAAADLGAAEAAERVRALGGACFPAHIDREGYSLLCEPGGDPAGAGLPRRGDQPARRCPLAPARSPGAAAHAAAPKFRFARSGADAGPAGVGGSAGKFRRLPAGCAQRALCGALVPPRLRGNAARRLFCTSFVNFFTTHFLHFPLFPGAI